MSIGASQNKNKAYAGKQLPAETAPSAGQYTDQNAKKFAAEGRYAITDYNTFRGMQGVLESLDPGWGNYTKSRREAYQQVMASLYMQAKSAYEAEGQPAPEIGAFVKAAWNNPQLKQYYADTANAIQPELSKEMKKEKRVDLINSVLPPLKIVLSALSLGGLLTPSGYEVRQATPAVPGTTQEDLAGTITPYQPETPALPASTDPTFNAYLTGQQVPGAGLPPLPGTGAGQGTPVDTNMFGGKSVEDTAKDLLNGKLSWSDILTNFGEAAVNSVSQYLGSAQGNRQAEAWKAEQERDIAQNQAFMEKEAERQRGYVDVDYARQMDDLRRSQYMQELHERENLAQRGITPETKSSIAQAEWRRLSESKKTENEGAEILKKRKMEEIASGLERSKMASERAGREVGHKFDEAYTSWSDVFKPKNTAELWGGILEEGVNALK